jgi:hypothetical protein
LAVTVWAIVSESLWFLNFVHVFCGLIGRLMRRYFFLTAAQGTMQILTIIIMTHFRAGI